jgi:hypothetical protein
MVHLKMDTESSLQNSVLNENMTKDNVRNCDRTICVQGSIPHHVPFLLVTNLICILSPYVDNG